MPKRTFQPSNRRRSRRLGFLARSRKSNIIAKRRSRGRKRLVLTK